MSTLSRSRRMLFTSPSPSTIRVEAPADLDEGYQFDVVLSDGQPFTVTVPPGGVARGETLEVPFVSNEDDDMTYSDPGEDESEVMGKRFSHQSKSTNAEPIDVETGKHQELPHQPTTSTDSGDTAMSAMAPQGRWRTHVYSCCDVLTQATFWMACCCPPVLMAQLVTRLKLDWQGRTVKDKLEVQLAYNKIVISFIAILVVSRFVPIVGIIIVALYCLALLLTTGRRVRAQLRQNSQISTCCKNKTIPGAVEDVVCLTLCSCCTLVQMARQTHNDKEYPGYCCTTSGLDPEAPDYEVKELLPDNDTNTTTTKLEKDGKVTISSKNKGRKVVK